MSSKPTSITATGLGSLAEAGPPVSGGGDDSAPLHRVVEALARVQNARTQYQIQAIQRVASAASAWLQTQRQQAREELAARLAAYRAVGTPPALFRLMGLSRQERAYNRLLAWLLDPSSPAGGAALKAVAGLLLPELAEDLQSQLPVEVRGENAWPPEANSSRQPDLLVLSPRCALLIENKVQAGESGPEQYSDYQVALETLRRARGLEHAACWLAAPDQRTVPAGWDGCVSHGQIADLLRQAVGPAVPPWGRIVLTLAARQIEQTEPLVEALAEAEKLLARSDPGPVEVARMLNLIQRLGSPIAPWSEV